MGVWIYMQTNRLNSSLVAGVCAEPGELTCHDGGEHKFAVNKVVYLEQVDTLREAADRLDALERMPRLRKEVLINQRNPTWRDLGDEMTRLI